MAAQDMNDALKNPQPDVPFVTVVDDTNIVLTKLAAIITNKLNNTPFQATTTAPKAAENKQPSVLVQPVLTSPVKNIHQTRFQTQSNPSSQSNTSAKFFESQKLPHLPRVVTPAARGASPPMVP